jgi:hypothetical protein
LIANGVLRVRTRLRFLTAAAHISQGGEGRTYGRLANLRGQSYNSAMSVVPRVFLAVLFPELDRFDHPTDASAALEAAKNRALAQKRRWLLVAATGLAAGVVVAGAILTFRLTLGWDAPWLYGLSGVLPGPASVWAANIAFRRPIQRALRRELVSQGVPICIPCGYDLRGNVSGRCPECGVPTGCPPRGANLELTLVQGAPTCRPPSTLTDPRAQHGEQTAANDDLA